MNFTIYSKEGCPYCTKIKMVLEMVGANHVVYLLGKDFTREQFISEFGENKTFPQVICDEKHLGGCNDTISFLKKNKIVS